MADETRVAWWRRTRLLALLTLAAAAGLIALPFAFPAMLGASRFLGLAPGTFFAVTGLPLVLLLLTFRFVSRQSDIDRRHGHFED